MPSSTFFGLPAAKQAKIIAAAEAAYTKAPASQVTIADVIHLAGIPRGSFYQYFKDKDDLYFFLISTFHRRFQQKFIRVLDEQHGNIFNAVRWMLHQEIFKLLSGPESQLIKNLFMDLDFRDYSRLTPPHPVPHHTATAWTQEIKQHTDLSLLTIDDDQFDLLVHMLLGFLGQAVARFLMFQRHDSEHTCPTTEFETQFDLIISWLEHGVLKKVRGNQA